MYGTGEVQDGKEWSVTLVLVIFHAQWSSVTVSDPTSRRRGEHSERLAHRPHAFFDAPGSGKLFSGYTSQKISSKTWVERFMSVFRADP
jgi:hypothetical protein